LGIPAILSGRNGSWRKRKGNKLIIQPMMPRGMC